MRRCAILVPDWCGGCGRMSMDWLPRRWTASSAGTLTLAALGLAGDGGSASCWRCWSSRSRRAGLRRSRQSRLVEYGRRGDRDRFWRWSFLDRWSERDRADERRALDQRARRPWIGARRSRRVRRIAVPRGGRAATRSRAAARRRCSAGPESLAAAAVPMWRRGSRCWPTRMISRCAATPTTRADRGPAPRRSRPIATALPRMCWRRATAARPSSATPSTCLRRQAPARQEQSAARGLTISSWRLLPPSWPAAPVPADGALPHPSLHRAGRRDRAAVGNIRFPVGASIPPVSDHEPRAAGSRRCRRTANATAAPDAARPAGRTTRGTQCAEPSAVASAAPASARRQRRLGDDHCRRRCRSRPNSNEQGGSQRLRTIVPDPVRFRRALGVRLPGHVLFRPHRQSRRDRLPHRPHRASGSGCAHRGLFRRPTPARCMCASPTRRICIGPAPARESYLAIDKLIAAASSARRRLHPSGLRLSGRERRIRGGLRRRRHRLRRPAAVGDPRHGAEGPRQGADGESRRAGRARLSRRTAGRRSSSRRRPTRSAIRC